MIKQDNNGKSTCQICNKEYSIQQLVPAISVWDSLVKLIKNDFQEWNTKGFICLDDLNKYKTILLKNTIAGESGNIETLQNNVLKSLSTNEIISKNLSDLNDKVTFGEKIADKVAQFAGSWKFIITFFVVLILWMVANIYLLTAKPFDPYPFILLNLVLSCLAAIQAPIIIMSQNRMETKDRKRGENDYETNLKAELEIKQLNEKMDHLLQHFGIKLLEIQQTQTELSEKLNKHISKG